ncbi:hypothetical protein AAE028_28065 [Sinorhizobium sp. CB9]
MPKDDNSMTAIRKDAEAQFVRTREGAVNSGVSSAKPRVITGSDDATIHKLPPGQREPKKDWDINYDPLKMKEGNFRG